MSGKAETIGYSETFEYSDYTYDEVLEAAAVFTLTPSSQRWVDVRTIGQRQADAIAAFESRISAPPSYPDTRE